MPETYIALLRAVNVAGASPLTTKAFVGLLGGLGLRHVRTYIQTGNAVFQAEGMAPEALAAAIRGAIERSVGVAPEVMLLTLDELEAAVASNPYPEADDDPKSVHLMFLAGEPQNPNLNSLEQARKPSEQFALSGKVFYFHAPEGVGRSKLFAKVERALGVPGTARNWRTTSKILDIAREVTAG